MFDCLKRRRQPSGRNVGRGRLRVERRDGIDLPAAAAIGVEIDHPDIKPLIPDAQNVAFAYFRKTGIYPINHGIVIRNELLKDNPSIADDLMQGFQQSKTIYLNELRGAGAAADKAALPKWDKAAAINADVVGDPFPFGIEANRKTLSAFLQYGFEQGVFHRLRNVSDEPFSLLALWPQPAARGANGIHDLRLDTWGTGFKLRSGCQLVRDAESMRVTEPAAGWDPRLSRDTATAG